MKPSAVVMIRWYSFYESAVGTFKLWRHLLMFIDHPATDGEKAKELLVLHGDNENWQSLYVKLKFLIELLLPIHGIQKLLESGEPLLHKMSHIVAVNLQSEMTRYSDDFTLSAEVTSVINILPVAQAQAHLVVVFLINGKQHANAIFQKQSVILMVCGNRN